MLETFDCALETISSFEGQDKKLILWAASWYPIHRKVVNGFYWHLISGEEKMTAKIAPNINNVVDHVIENDKQEMDVEMVNPAKITHVPKDVACFPTDYLIKNITKEIKVLRQHGFSVKCEITRNYNI